MNKLVKCYWILKGVGFRNVPRRLLQAWRIHSGYLANKLNPRRFSDYYFDREVSVTASEVRNAISGLFPNFVNIRLPDDDSGLFISKESSRRYLVERCERALEGQYLYFGSWYGNTGWPPDFNLDPKHCLHYPNNEFALKTAKSGPPGDDIKLVWESSRFSMAFYFARLYARTGDETWSEAFWCMFDAWIAQCPPLNSVAWGCGQESTFRMMAILFAAAVTLKSASVTDERLMRLAKFIWQTGRLISYNINYALSQGNNHGISEAVGLLTAGLILSHFSRANQAERWIIRGKKYLIQEVNRQIYKDGSFVQNSMNYHRVMLDDLLWGLVLLKEEIPESVCRKIELATNWLAAFVNPLNGRVPNYGANDGAQVLPLSCCDYLDYRPVLQAAWFACYHKKFFESGPWDEKLHWLFNPERQEQDNASPSEDVVLRTPSCREFGAGGYYILRSKQSWGFTRCHTFKNRPGEPDMLHFDLWYQGRNIIRDGGSYHYYTTEPEITYFQGTVSQNTVELDHQPQMMKGPGFLQFYWTKSKLLRFEATDREVVFEGEHYSYHRLPGRLTHRRKITVGANDIWQVVDLISAQKKGRHTIISRFRLEPGNWLQQEEEHFVLWTKENIEIRWKKLPGFQAGIADGYESLYYGQKETVPVLTIQGVVELDRQKNLQLEYQFIFKN